MEIRVIFVYGQDYTRHMNILLIPGYVQILSGVIMLFICLASIVLWIIRRKLELRRNDFVSAFIDTIIPFIGGGNVRMEHKWEKWFFAILLIGAFFITTLFAGDLLDCVYLILNQKITTFDQLAEMNAPIYIVPAMILHHKSIDSLIR